MAMPVGPLEKPLSWTMPFKWLKGFHLYEEGKTFYLQPAMRNAIEAWGLAVSISKGCSVSANTPKVIRVSAQPGQEEAAHFNKGRTFLQRSDNGDAIDNRDTHRSHKNSSFCLQADHKNKNSFIGRKRQLLNAWSSHHWIQLWFFSPVLFLIEVMVDTQIPRSYTPFPTSFPFLSRIVRYFAF